MTLRRMADLAFCLFLGGVALYVVVTAQGWPLGSRLFPTLVGTLLGGLLIAQVATTLLGARRAGRAEDAPVWPGVDPVVARTRALQTAGSIVAMAGIVWALGFPIGGPVALAGHLFLVVRERLLVSTTLVLSSVAVLWALSVLLNIPFPEPLVPGLRNPF